MAFLAAMTSQELLKWDRFLGGVTVSCWSGGGLAPGPAQMSLTKGKEPATPLLSPRPALVCGAGCVPSGQAESSTTSVSITGNSADPKAVLGGVNKVPQRLGAQSP